jgi:hypothetical protein
VNAIARLITLVFDAFVLPFGSHRAAALVTLSIVGGAVLALVYHLVSNPERIRRSRSRLHARILEMRLYPDDVVLLTRALRGALVAQLEYLRSAFKPIVIVALLALPLFFQIESRFARRPLRASESTLVTAVLKAGLDPRAVPVTLGGSDGVVVDPRSLRVRASREIVWRVNTHQAGAHALTARVYDYDYRFSVRAEEDGRALGTERHSGRGWDWLVRAGLPPIPRESALEQIRVAYPEASYALLGARLGWLTVFILGTLVGALIPTRLLRIQL